MTALAGDVLAGVEQLVVQQLQLLRHELRQDLRQARTAAIFLGAGLGVTLVGGLLFCLMPPYWLHWSVPELPLWACFGSAGGVFLLLGGGAVYTALEKFQASAALPESLAALKENVACLLKPK
jgi:hypothetical protein